MFRKRLKERAGQRDGCSENLRDGRREEGGGWTLEVGREDGGREGGR